DPPSHGAGTSWSRLNPTDRTGLLMEQAWVVVGGKFPVQNTDRGTLFEVGVTGGDDDHLMVEGRSEGSTQKLDLRRDQRASVRINGREFQLLYPSVYVNEAGKPSSGAAMLIVTSKA